MIASKELSKKEQQYAINLQRQILFDFVYEFKNKHLSKNFFEYALEKYSSKLDPTMLEIAPKSYDTAWYIKTMRKKGKGEFRYKQSSYAMNLNKYGSEFEVFKKKSGLPPTLSRKTIAELGVAHLERVTIRPHNHKNFINDAILHSVMLFEKAHRGEIERIKIWLP